MIIRGRVKDLTRGIAIVSLMGIVCSMLGGRVRVCRNGYLFCVHFVCQVLRGALKV